MSDERAVFQTPWGDIHFGFYPDVAPVTAQHIFKLVAMGAYTGNHIFRVDKGFVAQVQDVVGGRNLAMDALQKAEGDKAVPLEVRADVKHTEGVVSMGRYDDPNSGKSSFSFLLGAAPHLDMKYTIFGKVTQGMEVLHKLEGLETIKQGIFVMPKERVAIHSTYWYLASKPLTLGMLGFPAITASAAGSGSTVHAGNGSYCSQLQDDMDHLRSRFNWQAEELQRVRAKCLPS
ncbi:hypothetical protein OEZ86_009671 [Tetradesmus obliquus]|uniref:Peptidyl-prolyl cis-trans isomerase n=1 Tax=Tetradesmus obliquus TaxID=3088 RepID=A0ABY8UMD6_TETOB|nr:hypothetical protein OEZ85_001115 [Tetradesmus obliquus]WIA43159.1 hypothetical protein OEZ86_009671 [Tetradesmus obliquus]